MLDESAAYGALVPDAPPPRWFAATLAAAAIIAIVVTREVASWDLWWHLAIGREALASKTSVPVDTFSYSFSGAPYVHKDLLADIVFFGIFDRLGHAGIALIKAFALACAFGGVRLALGRHARPLLWLVLCVVLAAAMQSRIVPRPLVFTLGFFPLMLGLIERARRLIDMRDWTGFFVAMLPAIFVQWVWLNLHRGGVIGLVLLLGLALCLTLQRALHALGPLSHIAGPRPGWHTIGVSYAVFVVAVGVGLINPSGAALYTSALSVTHDPIHRSFITEWQPLTPELAVTVHPIASALILVTALALVVRLGAALFSGLARRPQVDVWHVGVLALFAYQGVASMRWLSYASAAAVVALALVLAEAIDEQNERRPIQLHPIFLPLIALLGMAGLWRLDAHPLGLGPMTDRYPERALLAASDHELGQNVHNAFVYGGYLTFADEERKVLIDGRNDMVYPSEFFLRCSRSQHDVALFDALWDETGGDWVLADNTPGRETHRFLAGREGWMAVHWSEPAVIYVRESDRPDLRGLAFRWISPADPVGSLGRAMSRARSEAELDAIRHELVRMASESPLSVRANSLLALYYDARGTEFRSRRDGVLAHLNAIAPDHPAVIQLTERLLSRERD